MSMNYQSVFSELVHDREDTLQDTLKRTYRILFLEDNPDDIELMRHELSEAGMDFISEQTDKRLDFGKFVSDFKPDIILADYSLSTFNGMQAFYILRKEDLLIPFILVTGALSEQLALECLKEGVDDFILKSSFKRLPAAIANAVKKKEVEQEKNLIAQELRKSHDELQLLVERQQSTIEDERMSIARDLHDELGQTLTALKIDITMLRKKLSSGTLTDQIVITEFDSITKLINKLTGSVKRISSGLRPETLDELGIIESIRWQAAEFEKRYEIKCSTFLNSGPTVLDRNLSIALFRIVQESLTNVVRHANATQVEIFLEQIDDFLFLAVSDNGKGIHEDQLKSSQSLGLIGLRERVRLFNGKLNIRSEEANGTMVSVMIPLTQSNQS